MRIAIVTGITGQDGSYLAELLLEKNYRVYGMIRRSSNFNTSRIDHIFDKLHLVYGDLTDIQWLYNLLDSIKNLDYEGHIEFYNLAAQSHVQVSFEMPEYTANVDAFGTCKILQCIKSMNMIDKIRFYQASTSELYGLVEEIPQTENTPFHPASPYGVAKLYSFWMVRHFREAYSMFAVNGILFNHESPRRGPTFVTRKITKGLADILNGKIYCIKLGNLNSKRDWGHAKDYVYAMWLMLQHDTPRDFVIATGEQYSVRDFVEKSFSYKNLKITWQGENEEEVGVDEDGIVRIRVDKKYFRPLEVPTLLGDPTNARTILGWTHKQSFDQLVREMVDTDCQI